MGEGRERPRHIEGGEAAIAQQEAATRPKDYTLDPEFHGFIPIPNTPVLIKFNAKPHVDMMVDNKEAGNDNRFRDDVNMSRLRYLPQKANGCNPDGLPVGFVKDPHHATESTDYLGLTCAACHTTEIHYNKTAYRIDGGPGMGDADTFRVLLQYGATMKDPGAPPVDFVRTACHTCAEQINAARRTEKIDVLPHRLPRWLEWGGGDGWAASPTLSRTGCPGRSSRLAAQAAELPRCCRASRYSYRPAGVATR